MGRLAGWTVRAARTPFFHARVSHDPLANQFVSQPSSVLPSHTLAESAKNRQRLAISGFVSKCLIGAWLSAPAWMICCRTATFYSIDSVALDLRRSTLADSGYIVLYSVVATVWKIRVFCPHTSKHIVFASRAFALATFSEKLRTFQNGTSHMSNFGHTV